jgi:hypothetical protein
MREGFPRRKFSDSTFSSGLKVHHHAIAFSGEAVTVSRDEIALTRGIEHDRSHI